MQITIMPLHGKHSELFILLVIYSSRNQALCSFFSRTEDLVSFYICIHFFKFKVFDPIVQIVHNHMYILTYIYLNSYTGSSRDSYVDSYVDSYEDSYEESYADDSYDNYYDNPITSTITKARFN